MHNNVHTHTFKLCLKENRPKKVEKQGDFLAAAALKNIIACKRLIRLVFHKFRCAALRTALLQRGLGPLVIIICCCVS